MGLQEKYLTCRKNREGQYAIHPKYEVEGDPLMNTLEKDLKARMERVQNNLEACGSLNAIIDVGGAAAKAYLDNTLKMIALYFFICQVNWLVVEKGEIDFALDRAKKRAVHSFYDSWEVIEAKGQSMREKFIDVKYSPFRIVEKTEAA